MLFQIGSIDDNGKSIMSLINIKQIKNKTAASAGAVILYDGTSNKWSNEVTNGLLLPVGTSADRLLEDPLGTIRYNSTTDILELNNGNWSPVITSASAIGNGTPVYFGRDGDKLLFQGITGGGIIQVSQNGLNIKISAASTGGGIVTETATGTGEQIITTISGGTDIRHRTISVGGIISLSASPVEINISANSTREMIADITQNGHGFTQGQVIYLDDNDNTWKLAIAVSADTLGVAMVDAPTTNNFKAVYGGKITGLLGLTPGQYYFVSPSTPGAITSSEPQAPFYANPILHAVTSNTGIVLPYRPNIQSSAAGGFTLEVTNLGGGEEIAILVSANRDILFRTLTGGGGIDLSITGNNILISAKPVNLTGYLTEASANSAYQPLGSLLTLSQFTNDVGYITQASANFAYQTIGSISALSQLNNNTGFLSAANFVGAGIIQVRVSGTTNGKQIFISAARTLTVSALGTGAQLIEGVSGNSEIRFRTLTTNTGNGITIVTSGNNIEIRSSAITQGRHTLWQPAGSMVGKITGGADFSAVELGAAQIVTPTYNFDPNTNESVQFSVAMPKSWNEGSLAFQFYWTYDVAGAGNVVWSIRAISYGDSATIGGSSWGTAITVTDASLGVVNDLHISPETTSVTVGNTSAENDLIFFEITRNATAVTDTFTQDAKLLGVKIFYDVNAPNDN